MSFSDLLKIVIAAVGGSGSPEPEYDADPFEREGSTGSPVFESGRVSGTGGTPKTWRALTGSAGETFPGRDLAGTVSGLFEPGEHRQIGVKVIDDRGNELLVVKSL